MVSMVTEVSSQDEMFRADPDALQRARRKMAPRVKVEAFPLQTGPLFAPCPLRGTLTIEFFAEALTIHPCGSQRVSEVYPPLILRLVR
jgi:hypothetical protein